MCLWSLHPKHLDSRGLAALWRKTLLSQTVLRGRTAGYRHHLQLLRFRAVRDPIAGIGAYFRPSMMKPPRAAIILKGGRFFKAKLFAPCP